ncbi:post-PEP-CTERM-1 domain-containing protein [Massilia sp. PWRC2]|uniref:post-PEP-CTERM-1 domain-containing protein n=1 Tax=Massilia sp. PWRC2 TaxID=2804626 RepID=UPI003CEC1571
MKPTLLFATAMAAAAATAAAQDAMVAVRDAQSGQLRAATAAELRTLGATSLALRPPPGQVSVRSDGRRQLHLGEAALVHLLLRRDGDGHTSMVCNEGNHSAEDSVENRAGNSAEHHEPALAAAHRQASHAER